MTIDQRLHRAAHELREIEIETPRFEAPTRSSLATRVGPAAMAGLLALVGVGGILAVDASTSQPAEQVAASVDPSTVSGPAETISEDASRAGVAAANLLTPLEEIAIISSLGGDIAHDGVRAFARDIPDGVI